MDLNDFIEKLIIAQVLDLGLSGSSYQESGLNRGFAKKKVDQRHFIHGCAEGHWD